MMFISYAQNFEDVILARALKGVEKGFYIDVGANDPSIFSVTKAFYERGWSGINIEPVKFWHDKLLTERPRDANLQIAISENQGTIRLFDINGTGLSTAIPELAERHRTQGYEIEERDVRSRPLSAVCEEHGLTEIHFLKIDVEGFEHNVLASADFASFRPWIVLVESTQPGSTLENHDTWEPILFGQGYVHAYFDGLNRFYVATEHDDLLRHFKAPPNVFDGFVIAAQHQAEAEAASVAAQLEKSKAEAASAAEIHRQQLEAYRHELETVTGLQKRFQAQAEERSQELRRVYASLSWRLTAVLRFGNALIKGYLRDKHRLRAAFSAVIRRAARYTVLRRSGAMLLRRFPSIQMRIRSIALNDGLFRSLSSRLGKHTPTSFSQLSGADDLTPEAQAILAELKAQLRSTQETHAASN